FSRLGTSGLQPSNRRAPRFFHSEEVSAACKQGATPMDACIPRLTNQTSPVIPGFALSGEEI
ncbi:hypothetical protein V0R59_31750, partial [Pseudomonas sp. 147P]|uniref:hypothetical protein n=1 Tax=Pseudomonas ulcerans TaxID=3115852 RepID=UPI002E7AF359